VELKERYAIVLITHSMMEVRRIAGWVAFFDLGRLVEIGPTKNVRSHPRSPRCAGPILGRIG